MVVTSKYSNIVFVLYCRRRINILHNARISDRVRQHASSDAHYNSWGHDGACFSSWRLSGCADQRHGSLHSVVSG